MARAKYQVLVIPFLIENDNVKYCVFIGMIWIYGNS